MQFSFRRLKLRLVLNVGGQTIESGARRNRDAGGQRIPGWAVFQARTVIRVRSNDCHGCPAAHAAGALWLLIPCRQDHAGTQTGSWLARVVCASAQSLQTAQRIVMAVACLTGNLARIERCNCDFNALYGRPSAGRRRRLASRRGFWTHQSVNADERGQTSMIKPSRPVPTAAMMFVISAAIRGRPHLCH